MARSLVGCKEGAVGAKVRAGAARLWACGAEECVSGNLGELLLSASARMLVSAHMETKAITF